MFFFFKQKTAYEMRISDWSSDVCSSDLRGEVERLGAIGRHRHADDAARMADHEGDAFRRRLGGRHDQVALVLAVGVVDDDDELAGGDRRDGRSAEHTSELQSLMRISYAVFCLKKKQQPNTPKLP